MMFTYYKVYKKGKRIIMEDSRGNTKFINEKIRKIAYQAYRTKKALRLPNDLNNINLAGLVSMDLFEVSKEG